jgi:general secretion pathway protein G
MRLGHGSRGLTLVELMLVMAIMGTLSAIAIPSFQERVNDAKVARAVADIEAIQGGLAGHEFLGRLPNTLAEIGLGNLRDPWGNPYRYLKFPVAGKKPAGARKDRFLVPINSSYDLYSMGKDGQTAPPLTSDYSYDDIVRANDGAFIGLGRAF